MSTKYRPLRLTDDEIETARKRRAKGDKLKDIAKDLQRSEGSISRMCAGKSFQKRGAQAAS